MVSTVHGLRKQAKTFVQTHGGWHTAILVIGFITIFAVIGALFFAAGDSPDTVYADGEVAAVESELFATSLSNMVNAPLEQGGTITIIPDKHLLDALRKKAEAGVDVRLLLPGKEIDNKLVRMSSQGNYEKLLDAGVKIYEYRPTFIHTKFIVVDGQWSIIGSPNLNSRSRQLDEENAFGILDTSFAAQLTSAFFVDLERSDEIKLDEWRRRNIFLRIVQRLAQTFDKQS